jgi:hypothetical protein
MLRARYSNVGKCVTGVIVGQDTLTKDSRNLKHLVSNLDIDRDMLRETAADVGCHKLTTEEWLVERDYITKNKLGAGI